MKTICITGANGFIGSALVNRIDEMGYSPKCAIRRFRELVKTKSREDFIIEDIHRDTVWNPLLKGADVVIHLAARVHLMKDRARDPLTAYRQVNTEGTLHLARQAAANGVKRFIFLSSIKVNGEKTTFGHPFTENDQPTPADPYAISKYEAEKELRALTKDTGLEVVVIRPPLVYGPGVKANFLNMMHWVYRRLPLPLGGINNKRSLVSLDNLLDLIVTCIEHPAAANQDFLVADGEDLSTSELLRRVGLALGKSVRFFPMPQSVLETGLTIIGKSQLRQRLCGSLQVNINKARELLDWHPPLSVEKGIVLTTKYFLENRHISM